MISFRLFFCCYPEMLSYRVKWFFSERTKDKKDFDNIHKARNAELRNFKSQVIKSIDIII